MENFKRNELQIIANALILAVKDKKEIAEIKDIIRVMSKINDQLNNYSHNLKEEQVKYVYVKYEDNYMPTTFTGKSYSYYTNLVLEKGDLVIAPTQYGERVARISEINVPREQVEHIIPNMKEITTKIDRDRFLNFKEIQEVAA